MTGGLHCSVPSCKSNSLVARRNGKRIRFFQFPRDPNVQRKWVQRCCKDEKWDTKNKKICQKHFTINDFDDVIQAQLLNIYPRRLKPAAIPTLLLDPLSPAEMWYTEPIAVFNTADDRIPQTEIRCRDPIVAIKTEQDISQTETTCINPNVTIKVEQTETRCTDSNLIIKTEQDDMSQTETSCIDPKVSVKTEEEDIISETETGYRDSKVTLKIEKENVINMWSSHWRNNVVFSCVPNVNVGHHKKKEK